jgi:uncharacterized protein YlxW (UPF0749 family)
MALTTAESSTEGRPAAQSAGPAAQHHSDHHWVWQVTLLSAAMGMMLALAVRTTDQSRRSALSNNRFQLSAAFLARYKDRNHRLQGQVVDLRRELSEYMTGMEDTSRATDSLKRQFEALKSQAGLSAVQGPGIKITLQDSTDIPTVGGQVEDYRAYLIHDQDLNNLLTELKTAGAEHLAISGADPQNLQRIVVRTTARCVGPTAVVNGIPLSAPYHILAIGDPKRLREYLERPDGYIRRVRQLDVLKMVVIEEAGRLVLPEYSGTLTVRYGKPVAETKATK